MKNFHFKMYRNIISNGFNLYIHLNQCKLKGLQLRLEKEGASIYKSSQNEFQF